MAQSSTMYPFNITSNHDIHNSTSLLERRQQNASHLQLELPSLPPLSQLMTENNPKDIKVEQEAVTMAAMEAAVTASMITSTAQPLIQQNFLPTSNTSHITSTQQPLPISNPTLLYNPLDNTSFMPEQQLSVAGLTDHGLMTMPPSFIDTRHTRESSVSSNSSDSKVYSFVAIPGTNQRKRPRRRYDEIERLYHCNWAGCTKAYGTLNHLNAHVSMQQHVSFFLFLSLFFYGF